MDSTLNWYDVGVSGASGINYAWWCMSSQGNSGSFKASRISSSTWNTQVVRLKGFIGVGDADRESLAKII